MKIERSNEKGPWKESQLRKEAEKRTVVKRKMRDRERRKH